jgi:VWFA-related protein
MADPGGRRRYGAAVVYLLLTAGLAGQEPSPSPSSFRVGAELVVVDLVATSRTGQFVEDLGPSEVQIFEDGKPRTIEFLRLVRRGDPAATRSENPQAPVPPADRSRDATDAAGPRHSDTARVAIVIDLVTTPAEDLPRVQDAILSLMNDGMPAGAEVMLATLWRGITIQQPFTSDKRAIEAAVRAVPAPAGGAIGFLEMLEYAQKGCEMTGQSPFQQLVALGKSFIAETRVQIALSSTALSTLTAATAALPGRKHIVLYSRGYALQSVRHVIDLVAAASACGPGEGGIDYRTAAAKALAGEEGSDTLLPLRSLIDRANRSQVSFYVVDPRGLVVTSPQARDAISARFARSGLLSQMASLEATLPQEYLRTLAGDTGGRAFVSTNDLGQGLRRAWADASQYYLIGYTPGAERKKGRYHKIDVKVSRPDLDLRFRRGYVDATDREILTADIANALNVPGVYEGTGLEVDATVERGKLRVVAYLPPSAIRFGRSDDLRTATINLHAILRDQKGKPVGGGNLFGREIVLRLKEEQFKSLMTSDNVEIPVETAAPAPGTYRLVVVARDSGGWLGARALEVSVK